MENKKFSRRNFNRLSAAALAGMASGCVYSGKKSGGDTSTAYLLQEPHVCRGLNNCKGKGACKTAKNACKGKNACAGQGKCASAEKHACHGDNACKGQGGCGHFPGQNACKGKGDCGVPLGKKAWGKARSSFEKAYKTKHGKAPGAAPKA